MLKYISKIVDFQISISFLSKAWAQMDNTIKRNLYLIISEAISNIKNHPWHQSQTLSLKRTIKRWMLAMKSNCF